MLLYSISMMITQYAVEEFFLAASRNCSLANRKGWEEGKWEGREGGKVEGRGQLSPLRSMLPLLTESIQHHNIISAFDLLIHSCRSALPSIYSFILYC